MESKPTLQQLMKKSITRAAGGCSGRKGYVIIPNMLAYKKYSDIYYNKANLYYNLWSGIGTGS